MEDGTVSIFGLAFGVVASAPNGQADLLAGTTGVVRGIIGHKHVVTTALQTLGIGVAAANLLVGRLVTGWITG
jgi:hypothetical protein